MIKLIDLIETNIAPKIEKFIIKHEPIENRYFLYMPNDITDGHEIGEFYQNEIQQEHPYLSIGFGVTNGNVDDIDRYKSVKEATKGMAGVKIEKDNDYYYPLKIKIPRKYFTIIEED